MEEQV